VLGVAGYLVYLWTKPALPAESPAVPTEGEEVAAEDEPSLPAAAQVAL
jgi:hypothetical protein